MSDPRTAVTRLIQGVRHGLGKPEILKKLREIEGMVVSVQVQEREVVPELEKVEGSRWWKEEHQAAAESAGKRNWEEWVREIQYEKGRRICGAKKSSDGTPCTKGPLKGRVRCRSHRGGAAQGAGHYNFEGKGYSRCLPEMERGMMEEVSSDNLLDLSEEVKVVVVRQKTLMMKLRDGEGVEMEAPADLVRIHDLLEEAMEEGDVDGLVSGIEMIQEIGEREEREWGIWREVIKLQEHQSKLVGTMFQMAKVRGDMMYRREVLVLFADLVESMKEAIKPLDLSEEVRNAVLSEVSGLLGKKMGGLDVRSVPVESDGFQLIGG